MMRSLWCYIRINIQIQNWYKAAFQLFISCKQGRRVCLSFPTIGKNRTLYWDDNGKGGSPQFGINLNKTMLPGPNRSWAYCAAKWNSTQNKFNQKNTTLWTFTLLFVDSYTARQCQRICFESHVKVLKSSRWLHSLRLWRTFNSRELKAWQTIFYNSLEITLSHYCFVFLLIFTIKMRCRKREEEKKRKLRQCIIN